MNRSAQPSSPWATAWLAFLATAGLILSASIWRMHHVGGVLAGCGNGGCDEILGSRWSSAFGVPVAALATGVYGAFLLGEAGSFPRIRAMAAGAAAGAAVWFLFVQAVILEAFCPWCLAAHGIAFGLVLSLVAVGARGLGSMLFWSAAFSFVGLGLIQVYGPAPKTHEIEVLRKGSLAGRELVVADGMLRIAADSTPRLGPANARFQLVEMFDYQCDACHKMAGYLEALLQSHPKDICVLLLPVPLDGGCNHHLENARSHEGSCEMARLAVAMWKRDPGRFAEFHRAMMAKPSLLTARGMAGATIVGEAASPAIAGEIDRNIRAWRRLSASTPQLPKVILASSRILHGLPPDREAFLEIVTRELGLPREPGKGTER